MVNLDLFVHTYDNVLQPDECEYLISLFDGNEEHHERVGKQGKPNFTQYNFTKNKQVDDEKIHNLLVKKTFEYRDKYYDFTDSRVFPREHALEQFRIKRYNTGGQDMFDTHVDVMTYASARRFLSFFWYLNDVDEGGGTEFTRQRVTVGAKKGRVVIFPAEFMFPHRGQIPISGDKYLIPMFINFNPYSYQVQ